MIILTVPLLLSFSMMDDSVKNDKKTIVMEQSAVFDKQQASNSDKKIISFQDVADIHVMEKEMYRNIYTKNYVVDYYSEIAGSKEIAESILLYADKFDLPFSTVFALVWIESRFRVDAVNYNDNSVDRGLFQLNSKSFPELTENDFFNLETNIMYGTKYLKWCHDSGENSIVALAMYNAGKTRVEKRGTPRMTLDYISRILSKQQELESGFRQNFDVCLIGSEVAFLIN